MVNSLLQNANKCQLFTIESRNTCDEIIKYTNLRTKRTGKQCEESLIQRLSDADKVVNRIHQEISIGMRERVNKKVLQEIPE